MKIYDKPEFEKDKVIIGESKTGKIKVDITETLLKEMELNKKDLKGFFTKIVKDEKF